MYLYLENRRNIVNPFEINSQMNFGVFYNAYYQRFVRYAFYYVNDLQAAEDLTHDALLYYWENKHKLPADADVLGYILESVKNKCLNYLALKQQEVEIRFSVMERAGIQLQNIIPDNQQPLGTLIKKELEHKIQEVIQKLPPVCKQVFMMSRFREMSYEEISQELGISVNTVKYHIKNALVVLKKEFGTFLCIFLAFYPTLLF